MACLAVPCVRPSQGAVVHGAGERYCTQAAEFTRGLGNEQSDLPVAGVEAERDGCTVSCAQATVRAED